MNKLSHNNVKTLDHIPNTPTVGVAVVLLQNTLEFLLRIPDPLVIAGFRTLLQQPPRHLEIRDILLCFQAVQELPQRRVVAGHHTVGSSGAAPLGDVGTAWQ